MKRRRLLSAVLVLVLCPVVLAACSSGAHDDAATPNSTSFSAFAVALPTVPEKLTEDDPEAWIKTIDENPVDEAFIDSLAVFSYRSASTVLAGSDSAGSAVVDGGSSVPNNNGVTDKKSSLNSTYSPISLYYALALAQQGAAGQTAEEISETLGSFDAAALPQEAGNLFRVLSSDPFTTIDLANSIWMAKDASFEKSFIDIATQQFYATPFSVEFGQEATDKAMGEWIAENTKDTIVPQVQTTGDQLLSIINTVYFKGGWTDPFDVANTAEDVFYAAGGNSTAEFMTQRLDMPQEYRKTADYTRASLSFVGGSTMTFVLPANGKTPHDIAADSALLEEAFTAEADDYAFVTYTVPKTTFDSTFDLIPPLKSMGMITPFSDQADFSNLTPIPAFISHVKQESFVSWDENGAEASAYTDLGISMMSAAPEIGEELDFRLDRPFLFEIKSSQGVPLFIGVCGDPTLAS